MIRTLMVQKVNCINIANNESTMLKFWRSFDILDCAC
jgi:hypothetical protein